MISDNTCTGQEFVVASKGEFYMSGTTVCMIKQLIWGTVRIVVFCITTIVILLCVNAIVIVCACVKAA